MPRTTHLLYLHGFRSSPRSAKAQVMHAWVRQHRPDLVWHCPQLPASPAQAVREVLLAVQEWPAAGSAVIGSSLGGFYATVVAERLGWRAAVLNPAVNPARDLARHIGQQTAWHDPSEAFWFDAAYVEELRELTPASLSHPSRHAAVIATGDEVLDWREMAQRYEGGVLRIVQGSNHALEDFERAHLGFVVEHLQLA